MQVHDADGTNPTRLKSYSNIYRFLTRCGAGKVAYWANDDKYGSHLARTDILNGTTTTLTDGPMDGDPTCTADGSTLVFQHCIDKGAHCFVTRKSLNSGELTDLHEVPSDEDPLPTLSPDGKKVLLCSTATRIPMNGWRGCHLKEGSTQVLKMPVIASEIKQYQWAPDGKSIPVFSIREWSRQHLVCAARWSSSQEAHIL